MPLPRAGVFLRMRVLVSFDGQNLYRLAKDAFGPGYPYHWPSYDVMKLADALATRIPGRTLVEVRFYTGVPTARQDEFWNGFWNNKLRHIGRQGVHVYRGRLYYYGQQVQEKGVDVRLAVDLVEATYAQRYDVAILVSQDGDLVPAVDLAKEVARDQSRTVQFESAFPQVPGKRPFGIDKTTWVPIDKATYDACLDYSNYRPPRT